MPYQTVLVTGGSRGIGAEIVRHFSSLGWQAAFCCRNDTQSARTLASETRARMYLCDVSREEQVKDMFAGIQKDMKRLDALIVNAGISHYGMIADMTCEEWDELFAVNVRGAFLCAREALALMQPRGQGAVTFISSMWGQVGASCEVAYSASKAALIGFAKALAKEVAPAIRVNCIAPGAIDTDMLAGFSDAELCDLRDRTPLERIGTPGDIARAAAFLSSEGAGFITGQVLSVNGGFVI